MVSSTPRTHFTRGIDPVPFVREAGWAPGSGWTGGNSRPHRDSIPDRPAELPGPQIFNIDIENNPTTLLTFRWLGLIKEIFIFFLFLFPIFTHLSTYTPLRLFQSSSSVCKCSLQGIEFYISAPFSLSSSS